MANKVIMNNHVLKKLEEIYDLVVYNTIRMPADWNVLRIFVTC